MWQAALEVTNLFEEYYYLTTFDLRGAGAGFVKAQPGRPREWALTITSAASDRSATGKDELLPGFGRAFFCWIRGGLGAGSGGGQADSHLDLG